MNFITVFEGFLLVPCICNHSHRYSGSGTHKSSVPETDNVSLTEIFSS